MSRQRLYYDFEFLEEGPGKPMTPISLGMVRDDGGELYLEFAVSARDQWCREWYEALPAWHKEHVLPHLVHYNRTCDCLFSHVTGGLTLRGATCPMVDHALARERILAFGGDHPRLIGYYADYDHVLLSQLFGRMIDLPPGWPKWTYDLKQLWSELASPELPTGPVNEHNALADARWNQWLHTWLLDWARLHGWDPAHEPVGPRTRRPATEHD